MKLQACPKCGAKFDVSGFARGQQFSCGACGQVLTAHAEAASPPPTVTGRAPGSRPPAPPATSRAAPAPAGRPAAGIPAPKGPQFRPPERHQDPRAAAAPPARERRPAREERRTERPAKKKSAVPLALTAVGVLVVVVAVLVLALGGKGEKPTGAGAAGGGATGGGTAVAPPPKAAETVESLRAEMKQRPPAKASEIKAFAKRFAALGPGVAEEESKALYRRLVETTDPNDVEARKILGYREFNQVLPDAISYLKYAFIEAVEEANRRRWFAEDESDEYDLAMQAWAETEQHAKRLVEDREYATAEQARANIAQDPVFKDYNYETIWARPYLICYSSQDRLSPYDLLKEKSREKRKEMLQQLEQKRKLWKRVLEEKAKIYQALYTEWMKRYAEPLGLKDLMAPYGGRDDYPVNVRSFQDGLPLIIWIFTDKVAFTEHHAKVVKDKSIHPGVAGYFNPKTGWVYLFDNEEGDRQEEIDKNMHEGTHQLEYWFTRQRNGWKNPQKTQDFLGEGIAEWIGAVKIDKARNVAFTGQNYTRLLEMQGMARAFEAEGKKYRIFPLEKLTGFTNYGEATDYGTAQWGIPQEKWLNVLLMFYEQAYALVYWLNDVKGGEYRDKFNAFFAGVLSREPVAESFRRAFRILDEDDWTALDEEFQKFITEDLMKRDLSKYRYDVPRRDDWGS